MPNGDENNGDGRTVSALWRDAANLKERVERLADGDMQAPCKLRSDLLSGLALDAEAHGILNKGWQSGRVEQAVENGTLTNEFALSVLDVVIDKLDRHMSNDKRFRP